ncbi:MAG: cytochrome c biogenesis protein CcsA [Oscillospiraceae bacterium]|nr:cytochrome c biogenesis protein CcsA [Oscillospiraceae bacterium]
MSMIALKVILGIAAVGYYTATVLYWINKRRIAYITNAAAWVLNAVVVGVNWVSNGYMPFVSMYQVLTFLGLCFPLTYLYFHFINKDEWMAKYFSLCSGIVMTGVFIMNASIIWHLPPALQSVWFIPHVFAYMLSYSLCAVASVFSIVYCAYPLKDRFFKNSGNPQNGNETKNNKAEENRAHLDKGAYDLILISFPFMTMGLFFGAIWANEAWSEFWSWDIKENWALVTWAFYSIYLHCRIHKSLKKFRHIFSILGLIALLMTFQGVSFFGMNADSPHTYT